MRVNVIGVGTNGAGVMTKHPAHARNVILRYISRRKRQSGGGVDGNSG